MLVNIAAHIPIFGDTENVQEMLDYTSKSLQLDIISEAARTMQYLGVTVEPALIFVLNYLEMRNVFMWVAESSVFASIQYDVYA